MSGLTGPVTAAHFHAGEAGKNGAVAVPIADAESATDLMGARWYLNIHTAAHKAGEIRGQMMK